MGWDAMLVQIPEDVYQLAVKFNRTIGIVMVICSSAIYA